MTTSLRPESKTSSRRVLLAGALGGLGAWAASAINRGTPARAADGDPVIQGAANNAGSATTITNTTGMDFGDGFIGESGLGGGRGVTGVSTSSTGVHGTSTSGTGVFGSGAIGVHGDSNANATGVFGSGGIGVRGESNANAGADIAAVFGVATAGSGIRAVGVWGRSSNNKGVFGESATGNGLYGVASGSGNGVYGSAVSGIGAWGSSSGSAGVFGQSVTTSGVMGASGGAIPAPKAKTGVFGYANQDGGARGVVGESAKGYAGYFVGKVYTTKFHEMKEISTPSAPSLDRARIFLRDNGGKTQLCVRFHTGAVQVIKTEP